MYLAKVPTSLPLMQAVLNFFVSSNTPIHPKYGSIIYARNIASGPHSFGNMGHSCFSSLKVVVDGIPDGKCFGRGIYATTEYKVAPGYLQGEYYLIIAKGILGNIEISHNLNVDSWNPSKDIVVFKHVSQLLPMYIIKIK